MCITLTLFTPQYVVKNWLKTWNMYVNVYFYRFVKNFFCKLRKIFLKKLLTFFFTPQRYDKIGKFVYSKLSDFKFVP